MHKYETLDISISPIVSFCVFPLQQQTPKFHANNL